MVIEPPEYSSGFRAFRRARSASSRASAAIVPQRLLVRVADDRRDQPVLDRHRDADVRGVELEDPIALKRDVDLRLPAERQRRGLHDQVVERDLHLGRLGLLADLRRLLHLDVDRDVEVRNARLHLGHALADDLAHPGDGDDLRLAAAERRDRIRTAGRHGSRRPGDGGRLTGLAHRRLDVALHDASARTRALDGGEVEPLLTRHALRQRRRPEPPVLVGHRRRGLLRPADRHDLRGPACLLATLLGLRHLPSRLGRGRRRLRRRLRRGGRSRRGLDLLALLSDDRDRRAHLSGLTLRNEDLEQHAVVEGLDLEVGLVGLDLGDGLTGGDALPLLLQPLDDLPLGHRRGERGERNLGRHRQFPSPRYITFFTASTIRSAETSVAFSSTAA